ncbi:hypothetical protein BRADI_1g45666v3 [Brachypodium distachyon]|uniref:Uncharacterized protein n=1 Tax=Brachypodium distachyon TaxID=15368 RepID=A0A2K2DPJ1_BRADI|nr:hypothetical protein BRADI_1g45666v3 [Brachypodium distachyon]
MVEEEERISLSAPLCARSHGLRRQSSCSGLLAKLDAPTGGGVAPAFQQDLNGPAVGPVQLGVGLQRHDVMAVAPSVGLVKSYVASPAVAHLRGAAPVCLQLLHGAPGAGPVEPSWQVAMGSPPLSPGLAPAPLSPACGPDGSTVGGSSLDAVTAFDGIPDVATTAVRSSVRIRAQPDADVTQLERDSSRSSS